MRKIDVVEAEKFQIRFADGKTFVAVFNMRANAYIRQQITEYVNDKDKVLSNERIIGFMVYGAIYAATQSGENEGQALTQDEANAMVLNMDKSSMDAIMEMYADSAVPGVSDLEPEAKKMIAQMLTSMTII